ncbi:helix-turn-helix domain-containing protein [Peredibacter starrii]|uniref:Helix-turn-helix transcriptional regulator n=1 Tax=Peredibacter starrii TaxID=28202 RepID=A0AAX4HVL7_9BACT|nr:helix-turn-helix transcriptional regulator [Peredibacter starrii]WPU67014.1 helix-turn-helix transcriptional regulator [Peredibacter starrii]
MKTKAKAKTKVGTTYEPDFFAHAKKVMGSRAYTKAVTAGREEAINLKLKMAREKIGLTQSGLKGLTQPEVSKIESRQDVKISTLEKYAKGLGMKVEINLIPNDEDSTKAITIYC